jgi:flavin-binding protein dodecin
MAIAKVIEISSSSSKSFDDAVKTGIATAAKTVHGIQGAWIAEQKVVVANGKVAEYRVTMRISFVLDGD